MVLEYANKGNLNEWTKDNYRNFDWNDKLKVLDNIIDGLNEIHQNQIIHRDLHTGNIMMIVYTFRNRSHTRMLL